MTPSDSNRAVFVEAVARLIGVVRRRDHVYIPPDADDVQLAKVGLAIGEARFDGGAGSSDYKVLTASWRIAIEAKTAEPTLPLRRLTGEAGIGSCETTRKALGRLVDRGWMEKVEHTDGRRGNRYALLAPSDDGEPVRKPGTIALMLGRPRDGDGLGQSLAGDVLEDSWVVKHDAFAYRALGPSAARLYVQLVASERTRRELVELTGLGRDTVRRNLERLAEHGLAFQEGDGWRGAPFSVVQLDAIASSCGTAGRHEAQAHKHEEQRRRNVMRQLDAIVGEKTDPTEWAFDADGVLVNLVTGDLPDVYGQIWRPRTEAPGLIAALAPLIRDLMSKPQ